jgi:hypothetical protein
MVVPVALVSRVPVAVVDVVDMTFVRHGDVPTVGSVLVLVLLMYRVPGRRALVHMAFVHPMEVVVVDVVGVVAVRDCDVAAAVTVDVRMISVCAVLSCRGHAKTPLPVTRPSGVRVRPSAADRRRDALVLYKLAYGNACI